MNKKLNTFFNVSLLVGSTLLSFLAGEWILRWSDASDRIGWNLVPSVSERVDRMGPKNPGATRILALGDSFAEWRDSANLNYLRVAEALLESEGYEIDLANLGQAGTGFSAYFHNLLIYGDTLDPDLVIISLYLGNDLTPAREGPLVDPSGLGLTVGSHENSRVPTISLTSSDANRLDISASTRWKDRLKDLAKKSILINYIYRLLKQRLTVLQSGFLDRALAQLQEQTGRDASYVNKRLAEIDPILLKAARADAINVWDLAIGVFFPDYYAEVADAREGTPEGIKVAAFAKHLATMLRYARKRHERVALVLIPPPVWIAVQYRSYFQRLGYGRLGPLVGEPRSITLIKNVASRFDTPVLDLLPLLRQTESNIFIPNDVHLNRLGHRISGEALAAFLLKTDLIGPQN